MKTVRTTSGVVAIQANNTANWYAWNNLQPPGPPSFHLIGDVEVPNPGVDVHLADIWIYRSFLSNPDIKVDLNKLEFARGTLVILLPAATIITADSSRPPGKIWTIGVPHGLLHGSR